MEFRYLTVNNESFGDDETYDISKKPNVSNVYFKDAEFFAAFED